MVAWSSSETEYKAMAHTTCEIIWVRSFLEEIRLCVHLSMNLYRDNQTTIYITSNPVFRKRTKHIKVDCHIPREKLVDGVIATLFVSTGVQLADMFTKL